MLIETGQIFHTTKPTGNAEVPEHIQLAWEIDKQIQAKAGAVAIDDPALDEADSSDEEVIEISDSNTSSEEDIAKSKSKAVSVAKAYHSSISELQYFCSTPHSIARIPHWYCSLYTTLTGVIDRDPAQHTFHQSRLNYQYLEAQYFNQ